MFVFLITNRLNRRVNMEKIQKISQVCENMCIFAGLYVINVLFHTLLHLIKSHVK